MEKIYGEKNIELPRRMYNEEGKLYIPSISDKRLKELYNLLKPIVTIDEMKYLLRRFTLDELRNISYIYHATIDTTELVKEEQLEPIDEFPCLHRCGYYGFFKPSVAEVLSQVPEKTVSKSNLFEIVEEPETRRDVFQYPEVINGGFHLSKVRTYKYHK